MDHLERARSNLRRASESASGQVHTQLDSLQSGIGSEDGRDSTRDGPDSTPDRLAEVRDKLESLQDEVEDPEVASFMENASEHLREYLDKHPHGE